jgi:hypothetical protein
MSESANAVLMRKAWHTRNELYRELFGAEPTFILPKQYEPPAEPQPSFGASDETTPLGERVASFTSTMTEQRINVLAYAPSEARPYWAYITSGLSNPWFAEEPDQVSGFGCELMIKAPKPGRWPIKMLRRMAYFILSYSGTLSPGIILNMPGPINPGREADLNNIFVWYADEAPDCWYELPSGGFGIFCTVGISEDECQFAETIGEYGTWCIQEVLRRCGVGQVTDPSRAGVMKRPNIEATLESVQAYADNFRPMTL